VVSFTQPSAGATVSGSTLVTAQATDDVRVEKVDLWVDGALAQIDTTSPYEFTWNTTNVLDGSHTLELRAYDIAGNRVSSGARSVTVKNSGATNSDIVLYAS